MFIMDRRIIRLSWAHEGFCDAVDATDVYSGMLQSFANIDHPASADQIYTIHLNALTSKRHLDLRCAAAGAWLTPRPHGGQYQCCPAHSSRGSPPG